MNDKVYVLLSQLGELSVAEWGVLKFTDGKFSLDRKKAYNNLQPSANKGGNMIRVLPFSLYGVPSKEQVFSPFVYDTASGKWDVLKYNDYYFPIVREYIEIAKSLNMQVVFELYDNCGLFNQTVRDLNPWCNNIQGISDFYNAGEAGYLYDAEVIEQLGDTVLYILGNELVDAAVANSAMSVMKGKGKVPFMYGADLDIQGEMASNSVMKKECVAAEVLWDENMKVQVFRPCHSSININSERLLKPVEWWKYHSVLFSNDGQFPRPKADDWKLAVRYVLDALPVDVPQFGQAGKVRLAFENCTDTMDMNYEASIIEAIVIECECHGLTFENKGKFPNEYQEPTPPTPPTPDPPPTPTPVPQVKCKYIYWINVRDKWFGIGNLVRGLLNHTKYCKVIKQEGK